MGGRASQKSPSLGALLSRKESSKSTRGKKKAMGRSSPTPTPITPYLERSGGGRRGKKGVDNRSGSEDIDVGKNKTSARDLDCGGASSPEGHVHKLSRLSHLDYTPPRLVRGIRLVAPDPSTPPEWVCPDIMPSHFRPPVLRA
jgi:hypothetical protein